MSVKVPLGSTQYQSHNRCKCDFCDSRRSVNAKKLGVSSAINRSFGAGAAPSFELDDPEHHVNQTELNDKTGRTGLANGDKHTIVSGCARDLRGAHDRSTLGAKSKEQEEREAMEDLDRLERLLILEHKARVKTTADAEKLALLKSTGKGPRPQPFDPAAPATATQEGALGRDDERSVAQRGNVGEVSDRNEPLSVTPPPHCDASHLLQHTIDSVREVTRDPRNPENAAALQRLLHKQGVPGVSSPSPISQPKDETVNGADASRMGKLWNYSGPRPEGAGVVWRKIQPSMPEAVLSGDGSLGNVDNRDLWKGTRLRGGDSRQAPVKTAGGMPGAPQNSLGLSAGATAALSVQQQEREAREKSGIETPPPSLRDAKSERL